MKSLVRSLVFGFASLAVLLVTAPAAAQTRLELDGNGAMVFETDGPPAGCGYPTGPVTGSFSYVAPFTCPTAGPVAGSAPFLGDVGSDRFTDTIWVTDGFTFTEYAGGGAAYGTPLNSFDLPVGFVLAGPVTGMDVVGSPGFLMVTDGRLCAGITPPAAPGCALPSVTVATFTLPWPGFATDLAWQGGTSGLWVCDDVGFVSQVYLDGTPGFYGSFSVAPGDCGLVPPLTGIAADGAPEYYQSDSLFVTDGVTVAHIVVDQSPPLSLMDAPFQCFPLSAPSCNGMGSTLHLIAYGVGTDGGALVPPVMTATGQTSNYSAPITLTLSGADSAAGTWCVLIYNAWPLCPPKSILGGNLLYVLPGPSPVGPLAVFGGTASITFTFSGAGSSYPLFFGNPMHLQWLVAKGSGGYQVSNAMYFTLGWP